MFNWSEITPLIPELFLCSAALFLLLYGVFTEKRVRSFAAVYNVAILALLATGWLVLQDDGGNRPVLSGMFVGTDYTRYVKLLICLCAAVVMLISQDWFREHNLQKFEFVLLLLFAVLGMMLMVSANSLMALYMAVELAALSQYVLTAFRREDVSASEAGLKYFILGAIASGMLLFGSSLVYGFSGSVDFAVLAQQLEAQQSLRPGVMLGVIFILVGFSFKISGAPFHMWTPDVYQGAPTPVTAFFSVAPKLAGLCLLVRVLLDAFEPLFLQWQQIVLAVSALSMLIGALGAMAQKNLKRLLAYSSIGHVGFALLGLASGSQLGIESLLTYLTIYVVMSLGAFACLLSFHRNDQYFEQLEDLSGLSQSQPGVAMAFAILLFSMAGIPPMAGFFAKLYIFHAAVEANLTGFAVFGVLASVLSAYYYLKVVKIMYFDSRNEHMSIQSTTAQKLVMAISAALAIFFILGPASLMPYVALAAQSLL